MAARSESAAGTPDREIVLTRVFDAPRELVFAAWTDPNHVARWWGPRGFTTTTREMEVRPGGVWRFVMHGPDGTDYPNKIVFLEVARPDRLVYQHAGENETDDVKFQTTVTFAEEGGKTRLTMRMVFETAAERDHVAEKYGAVEGGKQTLERLGEYLAESAPAGRQVVLTRVLDAPRELVFRAWTDPRHVARWWGPRGFTNRVHQWDARPGGGIRLDMVAPDGAVFPMGGSFHEVASPERLVFTSTALNDEAGVAQLEAVNTITLAEHGGKTTLTVRAVVVKAGPAAAGALVGMEAGWGQSLDRLAGDLAGTEIAGAPDLEIVSTRVFDAPRERVFEAFADPDQLKHWWGPNGFTTTIHQFDLRPGGTWRFVMHGPDGTDYHNESVFAEVVRPERIAFEHRKPIHKFWMTMTFAEEGGRTRLTWRMLHDSAEECAKMRAFVPAANEQNFDRLAAHLKAAPADAGFTITRTFDAPRYLVFKAWTETSHLTRWFGPKGFTTLSAKNDLRPGGVFHYQMRSPDGREMWGKWVYREIAPPERLAFVASFSDEAGNTTRAPFSADWPLEVLSTVTFAEHGGKTTLTMRGVPLNATEAERRTFEAGHGSMQKGWTGTLDQLAEHLARA